MTTNLFNNFIDDGHASLRESCRRFAKDAIGPYAQAWEDAGRFPRPLYLKATDAGVVGVGLPEALGGSGGGYFHQVMAIEGLMAGGSTGVAVGLGPLGIGLPPIIQFGSAAISHRHPALAWDRRRSQPVLPPADLQDVQYGGIGLQSAPG